jgi:hypothetical protein
MSLETQDLPLRRAMGEVDWTAVERQGRAAGVAWLGHALRHAGRRLARRLALLHRGQPLAR